MQSHANTPYLYIFKKITQIRMIFQLVTAKAAAYFNHFTKQYTHAHTLGGYLQTIETAVIVMTEVTIETGALQY